MDSGTIVYRGCVFLSQSGEPLHYVQEGMVTGVEADGVALVRTSVAGVPRFDAIDGWHADGRAALADASRQLDAIEQRFVGWVAAQREKIAERIAAIENASSPAEVQG